MGLFGFGKKKEEKKPVCSCQGGCCTADAAGKSSGAEDILILGSGCKNCQTLEANTRTALEMLGDARSTIGHVTDFTEIAKYGVMSTPGLVVKGKVVSYGKVLTSEEIAALLKNTQG